MKKITITVCMIILCSLSLTACQSLSNQDTGVLAGGVAGGLLGSTLGGGSGRIFATAAGTIAGAVIGGSVGKSMDNADKRRVNRALDNNPIGKPAYWHNANSNTAYEVVPVKNIEVNGNQYCREYRTVANIAGKKQQIYGTACRQPDGSWQAVN